MFPVPPELSQIIIDQLWDDTISLRAICLVSKAAIPFCRRHLFYEVKFHFQNRTESTKLLDVLKSRTKPGEHVRSLWLVSSSPYQDDMSTKYKVNISNRKGQQTEKEDRDMIQEAMAHIRLIREIHVENAPGEILGSYYSPGLLPRLRQVAIATFRGVTFVSLANFVDTLSYIPHCHSLRLENIAFGRENVSEVVDDDGRITPLRTLYLGLMSKGAFIEWMLASSSQSQRYTGSGPGLNITTLILKHITSNEGAVIKKLLRCLGTTLERLDINLAMDVAESIDLRHNTNLRFLAFDDWLISRFSFSPEWCTLILRSVGSRKLDTVVLRFQATYAGSIDISNIKILQDEAQFPNLRALTFENRRYLCPQLAISHLENNLPGLSMRSAIEYKMIPPDTLYHWLNFHTSRIYDEIER